MVEHIPYFATSYQQLCKDIITDGVNFGKTKAIFDVHLTFDIQQLHAEHEFDRPHLFLLNNRCGDTTAMTYALAESYWYMMQTRDPSYIIPYGSIWEQMVDHKGYVNSNYGYQISTNNNIDELCETLAQVSHDTPSIVQCWIATSENSILQEDTVCNNLISLRLEYNIVTSKLELSACVTARSIDCIYGLPYDVFAAQGFMQYIRQRLVQLMIVDDIVLTTCAFRIVNAHIYTKDITNDKQQWALTPTIPQSWKVIPYAYTPYAQNIIEYQDKQYILDNIKQYSSVVLSDGFDIRYDESEFGDWIVYPTQHIEHIVQQPDGDRLATTLAFDPTSRKAFSVCDHVLTYVTKTSNESNTYLIITAS